MLIYISMNHSIEADLAHFVKHLVLALEPTAKAESIELSFSVSDEIIAANFQPSVLTSDLVSILSRLIDFTPEHEKILVEVEISDNQKCKVRIQNTGINLHVNSTITNTCKLPITVHSNGSQSTCYELEVDLADGYVLPPIDETPGKQISKPSFRYYDEISKRLRSHFSKAENLVAVLQMYNPREAAFLAKVNALIIANLENTQFDANHLSDAMNMSRTQLFRRLKPIIKQSAGSYIRTVKLQKAKELLETTDMRISEVAYKTGFETASNFTKVFTKQYGMNPSLLFQKKKDATNE
jgi:AraC-like DNA-binding protein